MAQHIYDGTGKHVGTVKSAEEVQAKQEAAVVLLVVGVPLIPVLLGAWMSGSWLTTSANWHPLFGIMGGLALLVAALSLLYLSKWVRAIYLSACTLALAFGAYTFVASRSDMVWAVFASLVSFGFGCWFTAWARDHHVFPG
jgi:hypothetical protein